MDYNNINNVFVDYILSLIGPNSKVNNSREDILSLIKKIVIDTIDENIELNLETKIFCFGSFPLRSYLPESDMDVTIMLIDKETKQPYTNYSSDMLSALFSKINFGLEKFNHFSSSETIKEILFVNAEVKLIKCKVDDVSIDISINNYLGLTKMLFMKHVEESSFDHFSPFLFKKSLILIKSWAYYEANLLGSNVSLLATYALETLILYFFNTTTEVFSNELSVFFAFIKKMTEIDFDKNIITIYGLISKDSYFDNIKNDIFTIENLIENSLLSDGLSIKYKSILKYKQMFNEFKDLDKIQVLNNNKKMMNLKFLNIADSLYDSNNLGKSLNYFNFTKFESVFKLILENVNEIDKYRKSNKGGNDCDILEYINLLLGLFKRTVTSYNEEFDCYNLPQPQVIISNKFISSIKNDKPHTLLNKDSNNQTPIQSTKSNNQKVSIFSQNITKTINKNEEIDYKLDKCESPEKFTLNTSTIQGVSYPDKDDKDDNIISLISNDEEKKSTILNTLATNSFTHKESPYKISQLFNNENKIHTINKIQSDFRKPNYHHSHNIQVNNHNNKCLSNNVSPIHMAKGMSNSPYINIKNDLYSPQIPFLTMSNSYNKKETYTKEHLLCELAKLYVNKDYQQTMTNKNSSHLQPPIYLFGNYPWPSVLEVKNDKDKDYLLTNLSFMSNKKLSYINKDILEFFIKKGLAISNEDFSLSLMDDEIDEVEAFLNSCLKSKTN